MTEPATEGAELRVLGFDKSFGATHAVRDVHLTLRAGLVHALLGENGAGKSTLIALLAGFERPDSGSVVVGNSPKRAGFTSPKDALDLGIVTVFQQSSLIPDLTIAQNIAIGRRASFEKANDILSRITPIPLAMDTRVSSLDLGSRTVVEIARAISTNPQVLILDEPTALVDSDTAQRLLALVEQQAKDGVKVLLVTHKLAEVLSVADSVTVLRRGAVSGEFSGNELRAQNAKDAERTLLEAMFGSEGTTLASSETNKVHADEDVTGRRDAVPSREQHSDEGRLSILEVSGQDGLEFMVAPGEILGVAGIAGNGQRELAELLEGTQRRAELQIRLDGVDVSALNVRERQRLGISSLTDDRLSEGLVPALSVGLNLVLKSIGDAPFWRRGLTQLPAIREHANRAIAQRDIRAASAEAPVSSLSGGNAQKLLIARDVQPTSRVTIFRQPTQGLDARTSQAVHDSIREVSGSGQAVILISSDLDEIVALADRILVIQDSTFIAEVTGQSADTRVRVSQAISGIHR